MKLKENIYNLRKKRGFSQEVLAEKIKVSRQTISNWEVGETTPNAEQLVLLSKVLEVSVDFLLGNENSFRSSKKGNGLCLGMMIIWGCLAGIWAFSANRFRYDEMILIVLGGIAVGFGIGIVIYCFLKNRGK